MKRSRVVVPWREGLHLRPAAELVRVRHRFRSFIVLRSGRKIADLRSLLAIMALCATMGTPLDVEAVGDDELEAIQAVQQVFAGQPGAVDAAAPPPKP